MREPTRFGETRRAVFLEALRAGKTIRAAAALAGISKTTAYDTFQAEPAFGQAAEVAQGQAQAALLDTMLAAVHSAPDGWRAAAWLLERRWPDEFGPKQQVMLEGNPDRPALTVDIGLTLEQRVLEVVTVLAQIGRVPPGLEEALRQLQQPQNPTDA